MAAAGFVLALALGACSADSGLFSKNDSKFEFGFATPKSSTKDEPKQQRVVTADDLIGANGRCAGEAGPEPAPAAAPSALNFTAGPQTGPAAGTAPAPAGPAPARTGISLGMTECEVVRAIGHTDRIEISANERGQRSVTLTYLQGERPGIYRFVAGLLVSLERTGEEPPPAKAVKPKKAVKKEPPA
ncbi:MAG TPA: hypothetical protein VEK73_10655 [Xanthobacteraceae bacterium]|nr:hypothetical protein [Xanthobacteraceae bacterium]